MSSCHAPDLDAGCNRAEKDIESTIQWMSNALSGSVFEKKRVAEDRLLMQPLAITSNFANSAVAVAISDSFHRNYIWSLCNTDLNTLNDALFRAMMNASSAATNRGEDVAEYMNQWLAAWVSSPVSKRLLRAMQTCLDGCIFQVRGLFCKCKKLLPVCLRYVAMFCYDFVMDWNSTVYRYRYNGWISDWLNLNAAVRCTLPVPVHIYWVIGVLASSIPPLKALPLPMQLNPAGSVPLRGKVAASKFLGDTCLFLGHSEAASLMWPHWPALRALLLPRLRLIYNGLTALLKIPGLGDDNGRQVMAIILVEAGITASVTGAIHSGLCGGGAGQVAAGQTAAAPDPLVVELAQVLVQPQFLNMVQAGEAWARQHAQHDFNHLGAVPVSLCLEDITRYAMMCLHSCFCMASPSPIDPSSPKLQQAAFSWFAAALQMIKAGGWRGPWPANSFHPLLRCGLGIPLAIMIRRVEAEMHHIPQPLLPWADRPRYLECALQAAECQLLSAASTGEQCDDGYVLKICSDLITKLGDAGEGLGMVRIRRRGQETPAARTSRPPFLCGSLPAF